MEKNMKKVLSLVLVLAITSMSVSACGKGSDDKENSNGKTYKVAVVQYVDDASLNQIEKAIEKQLDALGKKDDVTFNYKDYTYNGQADQSTLNQIASDIVAEDVDIIVPIATPTAMVMQSATEETEIPIVFSAVTDPVGTGLCKSIKKPGANITGTSDALDTEAVFNLMLAANPNIKSIGLLYDKSQDSSKASIKAAKAFCKDKKITCIEKTGTTNDEISLAADALVAKDVDAVFTPTDNTVMTAELAIYEKFTKAKIPHYAGADSFALNGAFCGYGVNYEELGTATADMVEEILVGGKKPESMQVKTLDNGIATVNTDTAQKVGIDYSSFKGMCEDVKEIKTSQEFK